jgi:hypothetical protein
MSVKMLSLNILQSFEASFGLQPFVILILEPNV